MRQDLWIAVKAAAKGCWSLPFIVPAVLAPLWGGPGWLAIVGVCLLLFSAVCAAAGAYWRGETAGIKFMRNLWGRP